MVHIGFRVKGLGFRVVNPKSGPPLYQGLSQNRCRPRATGACGGGGSEYRYHAKGHYVGVMKRIHSPTLP